MRIPTTAPGCAVMLRRIARRVTAWFDAMKENDGRRARDVRVRKKGITGRAVGRVAKGRGLHAMGVLLEAAGF